MSTLPGIDLSGNNTAAQIAATLPGSRFVMVKATEGLSWHDPFHASNVAKARATGKLVGHYHFAWTEFDPAQAAANFLAYAQPRPGDLLALDLERDADNTTWAQRVAWTLAFLRTVKTKTGASPMLYVNGTWIAGKYARDKNGHTSLMSAATTAQWQELTSFPLWCAAWNGTPGKVASLYGWPVLTMHQYAVVGGVDRNVFLGDARVWNVLAVPAPAPPPAPAPKPAPAPAPAPKPSAVVSVTVPGLAAPITLELKP